ncbi:MAG: regulatory iron-sulfur-containing complex subunit RicT [Mycoplasmatota bacterium]
MKIISLQFKENGKTYYFDPGKLNIKKNLTVIVKTNNGLQFAKSTTNIFEIEDNKIKQEIKPVLRIATKADYQKHLKNIDDANEALIVCKTLIEELKLKMNVLEATYTFDRDQLVFKFVSENRVDFRELAKKLAGIYRVRIELRQVGIRDKAREVGGHGICGRQLCCASFLNEFESVTINMAKNQNIALNPTKINGVCGRLMCCLKYENDNYVSNKKQLPKIGQTIELEEGKGIVREVNVLQSKIKVQLGNKTIIEKKI